MTYFFIFIFSCLYELNIQDIYIDHIEMIIFLFHCKYLLLQFLRQDQADSVQNPCSLKLFLFQLNYNCHLYRRGFRFRSRTQSYFKEHLEKLLALQLFFNQVSLLILVLILIASIPHATLTWTSNNSFSVYNAIITFLACFITWNACSACL